MTGDFKPFGEWAERSLENGYEPVPLEAKKPALKNWNNRPLGVTAIRNFAAKHPECNLGFRTGCLVGIDIDIDEEFAARRMQSVAEGMLGFTPYVRIGKFPRRTLFYRVRKPVRSASFGKVDILGVGKLCVVAGTHPDTGRAYYWPEESLLVYPFSAVPEVDHSDLARFIDWLVGFQQAQIVKKRNAAFLAANSAMERAIADRKTIHVPDIGDRNNSLFGRLRHAARSVRTKAELLEIAEEINGSFFKPLPMAEVNSTVTSVWNYKANGKLMAKGQQFILLPIGRNDITAMSSNTDAIFLAALLKATRKNRSFTIPQKATAKELGWGSNRVKKAIEGLINAGWLRRIGNTLVRDQARYEWMGIFTV